MICYCHLISSLYVRLRTKMHKSIRTVTSVLFVVLLCLPLVVQADTHIVTKATTSSFVMMGDTIPASEMVSDIWMGEDLALMTMDTATVLIDMKNSIMYMIMHTTKTYTEMPIGSMDEMLAAMGVEGDDERVAASLEMMKNMMGQMEFTVTPTEETRTIGDYECQRFDIAMSMMMMMMNSQVWASEEIDCDMSVYFRLSNAMMAMFPGFEEAITEWKKIKGFPVLQTATMMIMGQSVETRSELVSVENVDAPEGLYDKPTTYQKTAFNPMGR